MLALVLVALPGCFLAYRPPATVQPAAVTVSPADRPEEAEAAPQLEEEDVSEGVFHVVQAGQTLWRIARGYGVPVETIVAANGLSNPETIEVGAAMFIPGARTTVDIAPYPAPPPPPPTRKIELRNGERDWVWPVQGEILSRFGARRRSHIHRGVDIRGRSGEEVVAARAGRVVFAGRGGGGYGLTVVIDHADGHQSLYAHNDALLAAVGDEVRQGQPVARCGRTGNATTEHVHFEIRKYDAPQDPLPLLGETLEARR